MSTRILDAVDLDTFEDVQITEHYVQAPEIDAVDDDFGEWPEYPDAVLPAPYEPSEAVPATMRDHTDVLKRKAQAWLTLIGCVMSFVVAMSYGLEAL